MRDNMGVTKQIALLRIKMWSTCLILLTVFLGLQISFVVSSSMATLPKCTKEDTEEYIKKYFKPIEHALPDGHLDHCYNLRELLFKTLGLYAVDTEEKQILYGLLLHFYKEMRREYDTTVAKDEIYKNLTSVKEKKQHLDDQMRLISLNFYCFLSKSINATSGLPHRKRRDEGLKRKKPPKKRDDTVKESIKEFEKIQRLIMPLASGDTGKYLPITRTAHSAAKKETKEILVTESGESVPTQLKEYIEWVLKNPNVLKQQIYRVEKESGKKVPLRQLDNSFIDDSKKAASSEKSGQQSLVENAVTEEEDRKKESKKSGSSFPDKDHQEHDDDVTKDHYTEDEMKSRATPLNVQPVSKTKFYSWKLLLLILIVVIVLPFSILIVIVVMLLNRRRQKRRDKKSKQGRQQQFSNSDIEKSAIAINPSEGVANDDA